jgi:hypothetical protein
MLAAPSFFQNSTVSTRADGGGPPSDLSFLVVALSSLPPLLLLPTTRCRRSKPLQTILLPDP